MRKEVHEISGGRKLYLYSFGDNPASERQRRFWNVVGNAWKDDASTIEQWMRPITETVHMRLGNHAQIALDLGCGARSMQLPEKWRAFGIDPAADMLVGNRSVQGDSHHLPFQDSSVDAVVSRCAVMLDSDPVQLFREVQRIIRLGGVFVFAVWNDSKLNRWLSAVEEILHAELGIRLPNSDEPHAYRLRNRFDVGEMLTAAKLKFVSVDEVSVPYFAELNAQNAFESLLRFVGPIKLMFEKVSDDRKETIKQEIIAALQSANRSGSALVYTAKREVNL